MRSTHTLIVAAGIPFCIAGSVLLAYITPSEFLQTGGEETIDEALPPLPTLPSPPPPEEEDAQTASAADASSAPPTQQQASSTQQAAGGGSGGGGGGGGGGSQSQPRIQSSAPIFVPNPRTSSMRSSAGALTMPVTQGASSVASAAASASVSAPGVAMTSPPVTTASPSVLSPSSAPSVPVLPSSPPVSSPSPQPALPAATASQPALSATQPPMLEYPVSVSSSSSSLSPFVPSPAVPADPVSQQEFAPYIEEAQTAGAIVRQAPQKRLAQGPQEYVYDFLLQDLRSAAPAATVTPPISGTSLPASGFGILLPLLGALCVAGVLRTRQVFHSHS